jgi:site-specific recombinase XerD
MLKVDAIKVTKKKKKAYSLLDLEKIRMGCRTNRERAMVEFLASTWCRVAEMSEVKISDIGNGKVTVHGKGDKYRECFLNARAQLALEVYLAERQDNNPYLFPRAKYAGDVVKMTKGTERRKEPEWYKNPENVDEFDHIAFGTIESIVRKIGRRVGVEKVHPHRFRRTGATMALRTGMPLTTVSKLLGHESIETTQIYLDISDEELEAAHKKFVV